MKTLILLPIFLLAGCATSATRTNLLAVGMTKNEAIGIMGKPLVTSAVEDMEYLEYRVTPGSVFSDRSPFVVVIRDGRVTAYGHPFNIAGPPRGGEIQPPASKP